jgi:hypothetical protein
MVLLHDVVVHKIGFVTYLISGANFEVVAVNELMQAVVAFFRRTRASGILHLWHYQKLLNQRVQLYF